MSSDHISRRNRANAQKSTGPKTHEGKARVAGNALKHGATAQPDPASLTTWLSIILDRAEISPQALMPTDDAGYSALALAQAEARIVAAENALRAFENYCANTQPQEELTFKEFFISVHGSKSYERHKNDNIGGLVREMYRIQLSQMAHERRDRLRLLKRYLSEAKSKRRKAFAAWLEISQREPADA